MKKKHKELIRFISWILFIIYLIGMVYFLFFCEQMGRVPSESYHYNLIPFAEITRYIVYHGNIGGFNVLLNLAGNVICFMPMGFVLPILSIKQRKFWKIFLISFFSSVIVELIQLISKLGSFDIDDIILNTTGGILGYLVFQICIRIMHSIIRKKEKR